jgi:hypothetical protein
MDSRRTGMSGFQISSAAPDRPSGQVGEWCSRRAASAIDPLIEG